MFSLIWPQANTHEAHDFFTCRTLSYGQKRDDTLAILIKNGKYLFKLSISRKRFGKPERLLTLCKIPSYALSIVSLLLVARSYLTPFLRVPTTCFYRLHSCWFSRVGKSSEWRFLQRGRDRTWRNAPCQVWQRGHNCARQIRPWVYCVWSNTGGQRLGSW